MSDQPFKLARHTTSILVTYALVQTLQLAALWVVALGWGEEGTGAFAVVITVQVVLQGVLSLGVAYANMCFVARDGNRRDELHTTTILATVGVSAVVVVGLLWGRHWLSTAVLRNVEPGWLITVAVCFPFALYGALIIGLWTGEERIGRINRLELLRAAVFVAGVLLALALVPGSVWAVLWAWAASFVVSGSAAFWVLWRRDGVRWRWRLAGFREALGFSLVPHLGDVASIVHQWFGLLLVNRYIEPRAAGTYFLALRIAGLFWLLAGAVRRAGARRVIGEEQAPSWELVAAMSRVIFWTLILPALVLMVASPWLVPVVFRGFVGSVRPLQVLLPAFVLASCGIVLANYVIGNRRRPAVVTVIAWVALAVNVSLCLILIGPYRLTGVAVATATSFSLPFLLLLPVFHRWHHSVGDLFVPRSGDLQYFQALLRHLWSCTQTPADDQGPP